MNNTIKLKNLFKKTIATKKLDSISQCRLRLVNKLNYYLFLKDTKVYIINNIEDEKNKKSIENEIIEINGIIKGINLCLNETYEK